MSDLHDADDDREKVVSTLDDLCTHISFLYFLHWQPDRTSSVIIDVS